MEDLLTQYFAILLVQFQWDLAQFAQPWMYWWLLVPATFFLMFFVTKWAVLTLPLWVPFYLAFQGLRRK